jgi:chromosome segregation ATPase
MVVKKLTDKNTKAEILQAYEDLNKEAATLKSQLSQVAKEISSTNKEKPKSEPNPPMNQSANIQQRMNYTIESLAKIQLGFGSAVNELSEKLTTQASKLTEIREAVGTEVEQLQQLHNLEVDDDTLTTLITSYEENAKTYQDEYNQRYEVLSQEILEQRITWHKEQEEYQRTIKERNENLNKTRQRDSAEYKYDLELGRKLATDEYEQQQKALYKQLEEFQQEVEKQWTEQEKVIAEREKQFEEYKAKVEVFPKEKEAAIKKATEEGKGIAHYQAKIKSDLYAKEVEGQKRFYEQRLQSLEQTISNQDTRLQNLSKQLDSALKQVQDLAVKAIEGTANVNSYQAIKEIALEQAKSQVKNK